MAEPSRLLLGVAWAIALTITLTALTLLRPIDHDESQYVAAATLVARGLIPYRDFAYLQTPLQPLLFAPVAALAGLWTWPALRIVNAMLGAVAILSVYRAARTGGAGRRAAGMASALFVATDIFLFSVGTARNDALPVACLAVALSPMMRTACRRGSRRDALIIGICLAAAAAAKLSYALPAIAYGIWALCDSTRRPWWTLLGAAPFMFLVALLFVAAPDAFVFGTIRFPSEAPAEWYRARPWKLSYAAKFLDTLKFLALGPALLAIAGVFSGTMRRYMRASRVLDILILAGLIAALAPFPTWRQYLLPMLPPLFVRLALVWQDSPPGRIARIAAVVFACAGLAPTIEAVARADIPMLAAMRDTRAIRAVLAHEGIAGPVATLSPQFVANPDPRFATGPFYFRSTALLDADRERAIHVVSHARPSLLGNPPAILTGGEGSWSSGDDRLDGMLARRAVRAGYRPVAVSGTRFTLYVAPPVSPRPVPHNNR